MQVSPKDESIVLSAIDSIDPKTKLQNQDKFRASKLLQKILDSQAVYKLVPNGRNNLS